MSRWLAIAFLMGCKSDPATESPKVAVTVIPQESAVAPSAAAPVESAQTPAGPLKKRDFASAMTARTPGFHNQCFDPYADKGSACVTLDVTVLPDGTVSSVAITKSTSPLVASCLIKMVKSIRFPRSELGGTFPFSICS